MENNIVCKDAFEFLYELKKNNTKPKLVLTDPPYGIRYKTNIPGDKRWNKEGKTVAEREGRRGIFEVLENDESGKIDFKSLFSLCFEILDKDSFIFVFSGWQSFPKWSICIEESGFKLKTPVFWNKKCANGGDLGDPLISVVETIIRAEKGNPSSYPIKNANGEIKKRVVNIWNHGRVAKSEQCGHPTQKPIYTCEQLIKMSTKEGELVIDPFCGSGSILKAAKNINRVYRGCDIEEGYARLAKKNLGE